MKLKFIIPALIIMTALISDASAQGRVRQVNQNRRMREGVRSGELTRAETVNLSRNRRHVRREIRQAKSDGVVTCNERREIRRDQRRSSRAIYRKKHNRRDRI